MERKLSLEFICGLVEAGGCFTFSKATSAGRSIRIPTFTLEMSDEDEALLLEVRSVLDLKNKIYVYKTVMSSSGRRKRGRAILTVRDLGQLKNNIVPVFRQGLRGAKSRQLKEWLEEIGRAQEIPESFRILHLLHRSGFYDKHPPSL